MKLSVFIPYFEVSLFDNNELVAKRIFSDDDILKAMDTAVSFCAFPPLYHSHTAKVELYESDELSEEWEFDGLNDPTHKVYE